MMEICKVLGVKKTLVYQTLEYFQHSGSVTNHLVHHRGWCCILTPQDIKYIWSLLSHRQVLYLDELQSSILQHQGVWISLATLSHTLRHIQVSQKCVSCEALKRNDTLWAVYMNNIGMMVTDMNMIMFIDKSAKDERTHMCTYGWAPKGMKCSQKAHFVWGKWYTILPVLTLDGIITYDIIQGPVSSARFVQFLCEFGVCL